jgi:uncharacterized protein YbaR (Trm112 family)
MDTPHTPIDPEFLAVLRCPWSKARLVVAEGRLISTDPQTRRAYPLDDGVIPVLAPDAGVALSVEEWEGLMRAAGEKR